MRVILALTLALIATDAHADLSLVCHNPGQSYNLTYTDGAKAVVINPDSAKVSQPVLATIGDVMILELSWPGMVSALHLTEPVRNEIFADGELIQTDSCK